MNRLTEKHKTKTKMKLYETGRLLAEPFLPPLYNQVRRRLQDSVADCRVQNPQLLDIGGRKSPYTIGLSARITVIDLPRQSELQEKLKLGIDSQIIQEIKKFRSNIEDIVLGDMTRSTLPSESFDLAVAVEVLEHVEEDERFVSEVARVLKPGGIFLMTTPNGDWVENKNPDHKRHYRRRQLSDLLAKYFSEATVEYSVAGGYYRKLGLKPWSVRHPLQTAGSIFGNFVNTFQSANESLKEQSEKTYHLLAVARKSERTENQNTY